MTRSKYTGILVYIYIIYVYTDIWFLLKLALGCSNTAVCRALIAGDMSATIVEGKPAMKPVSTVKVMAYTCQSNTARKHRNYMLLKCSGRILEKMESIYALSKWSRGLLLYLVAYGLGANHGVHLTETNIFDMHLNSTRTRLELFRLSKPRLYYHELKI